MRKLVCCFLLFFSVATAYSQKAKVPKPPFKVTKAQMYEDYDQFLHIVETYCPQIEVRMKTGYDMMGVLRARREMIEKIRNYWEFIQFMDGSVERILDVHADRDEFYSQISNPRYSPGQSFYDSIGISSIDAGLKSYIMKNNSKHMDEKPLQSVAAHYFGGNYYMTAFYKFKNNRTHDSICFRNARIIAYDHKPIDTYVRGQLGVFRPHFFRYDLTQHKYYTHVLMLDFSKLLKVIDEDDVVYEFVPNDYPIQIQDFADERFRWNPWSAEENGNDKYYSMFIKREPYGVVYLAKEKTLYVYAKVMSKYNGDNIYNMSDSIKKVAHGKVLEKVVIDVRDNRGGASDFWTSMLSAIIKDTLKFKAELAFNYQNEVRAYLSAEYPPEISTPYAYSEIPYLNQKQMWVNNEEYEIVPDSNSINYSGTIYIFQNEQTYSAANEFSALARQFPQLVSVGQSTGIIAGFGFNPWAFQLKNSHYTFRFETALDVTNAEKWQDVFHCEPEIEVIPSLQEWQDYQTNKEIMEWEEFLPKYDYLFKYILQLKD